MHFIPSRPVCSDVLYLQALIPHWYRNLVWIPRSAPSLMEDHHSYRSLPPIYRLVHLWNADSYFSSEKCQYRFDTSRNDIHNGSSEYLHRSTTYDPVFRVVAEAPKVALGGYEIVGRDSRLWTGSMAEDNSYDYLFWSNTGIWFLEIFLCVSYVSILLFSYFNLSVFQFWTAWVISLYIILWHSVLHVISTTSHRSCDRISVVIVIVIVIVINLPLHLRIDRIIHGS